MAKRVIEGRNYYENSTGALVPEQNIDAIDLLRDETVDQIISKAREMNHELLRFKKEISQMIRSFVELSADQYKTQYGGKKGNIKLRTIDGKQLVEVSQNEQIDFNEQLQIAEELIEGCINERAVKADPLLLAMVQAAFTKDSVGRVNVRSIMKLQKIEIEDPTWKKAMEAIKKSIEVIGTKEYIRFYERRESDKKMTGIPLDLAAI